MRIFAFDGKSVPVVVAPWIERNNSLKMRELFGVHLNQGKIMVYSNPRMRAVVGNWPMGGANRCTAIFEIETDRRGRQRAVRYTERQGKRSAPNSAQGNKSCDNMIVVTQGNMKFEQETISAGHDEYENLLSLLVKK